MLTYNSKKFTLDMWTSFRDFTEGKSKEHGAHAWSACIEESKLAKGNKTVYHTHSYFFWDGGDGVDLQNLDTFKFLDVPLESMLAM